MFKESGILSGFRYEKKNSNKREVKRLEKLKDAKQNLRLHATEMVKDGFSYCEVGKIPGTSHLFVEDWVGRLPEKRRVKRTFYVFRKCVRGLVATRKPGLGPGFRVDKITDLVVPVRKNIPSLGRKSKDYRPQMRPRPPSAKHWPKQDSDRSQKRR